MNKKITKAEFLNAEAKMERLLAKASKGAGFASLNKKEANELEIQSEIVRQYEEMHFTIPMPESLSGLLQLKMYEKQIKQKELAKLLETSDTQLSEIMHEKRKPSLTFLKSLNQKLGLDGNLLLKLV